MPEFSKIRWRASDLQKLEREIDKFNRKIYRERSAHPEKRDILPDTIKVADKKAMIEKFKQSPRSVFQKEIKSLERFRKKGAADVITSKTGNKVTRWEKNEVAIKVATINRARTKERARVAEIEATTRGKPIGLKRGEMMSGRMMSLQPKIFNFDNIRGGKEWEKYKRGVENLISPEAENVKNERYKANYLKALDTALGGYGQDLIKKLEKVSAEDIVNIYYQDQEANIDFIYAPEEILSKVEVLEAVWSGFFSDETLT